MARWLQCAKERSESDSCPLGLHDLCLLGVQMPSRGEFAMVKFALAWTVGMSLAMASAAALADDKKVLDLEPLSSVELSAQKGSGVEAEFDIVDGQQRPLQ